MSQRCVPPPIQTSRVIASTYWGSADGVGLGGRRQVSGHFVSAVFFGFQARFISPAALYLISGEAHAPLLAIAAHPSRTACRMGYFGLGPGRQFHHRELIVTGIRACGTRTLSSMRTCLSAASHGRHRRPRWASVSKRAWTGAGISGCRCEDATISGGRGGNRGHPGVGHRSAVFHPCPRDGCIMKFPSMISRGRNPGFPTFRSSG
ncbi:hypothetical protein MAPG_04576 [Magnaporthiopsis poae ATCC 64411]|uniref:Uncharacterized protein n=1 Tax=Magnaporthiopsis poae (strain ATCC 64411 / 73-15) TaxID=644358 RepID=A0A0C4DX38_MAGP6|nr:hypothetical protein MAPG_04576 [Magnaporthiopsis poae ATCC 64411]